MYKPSETVSGVLERYEDECQAIEDLVLEKDIDLEILEPIFKSVHAADVKPIMKPIPKRRLRQCDSQDIYLTKEDETYEGDPESSDHEVPHMGNRFTLSRNRPTWPDLIGHSQDAHFLDDEDRIRRDTVEEDFEQLMYKEPRTRRKPERSKSRSPRGKPRVSL